HAVHFMRTLPTGSVDPNFGRRVRNRRQLNSLQNTWPYGYSMPIAVRYTQDAFSRSGWLWPVDAKGEPLKATSYMAVGFYVAKYVNKKSDMDLAAKGLGAKELLIMFIPSTFKRPVSSWKALNLRKTLLMASSVRLKPLNCSRLPCVYAQETLTFLLTQKKTCVKNYVQKE